MEYRFQTSAYDKTALLPEVTAALEMRMEQVSRTRLPGLWKVIDSRGAGRSTAEMTRGRRIYRRVVGTMLLLIGLFLLIPGLLKPRELFGPLAAGAFAVGTAVFYLRSTRKKRISSFEKQAGVLLENIAKAPAQAVLFRDDGIQLQGQETVPYANITFYTETSSGILLNWGNTATFLQKKDLETGEWTAFFGFLREKMGA